MRGERCEHQQRGEEAARVEPPGEGDEPGEDGGEKKCGGAGERDGGRVPSGEDVDCGIRSGCGGENLFVAADEFQFSPAQHRGTTFQGDEEQLHEPERAGLPAQVRKGGHFGNVHNAGGVLPQAQVERFAAVSAERAAQCVAD